MTAMTHEQRIERSILLEGWGLAALMSMLITATAVLVIQNNIFSFAGGGFALLQFTAFIVLVSRANRYSKR